MTSLENMSVYKKIGHTDGAVFFEGDRSGSIRVSHGDAIVEIDQHPIALKFAASLEEVNEIQVRKETYGEVVDSAKADNWRSLVSKLNDN